MIDDIATALSKLDTRNKLTHGTSELVETIKAHTHLSYKKIGELAGVTEQGVRRWREKDSGETSRVRPLIAYANSLINQAQGASKPATSNVADALRAVTPLQVQTSIKHSLEALLGIDLVECSIAKLEVYERKAILELNVE